MMFSWGHWRGKFIKNVINILNITCAHNKFMYAKDHVEGNFSKKAYCS